MRERPLVADLVKDTFIPKMFRVRQKFSHDHIEPERIPQVIAELLSEEKFSEWKKGNLRCLEDVCSADLSKLHSVLKSIKAYAEETGLKPSIVRYSTDGRNQIPLRFTMSGNPVLERLYSTQYLDPWRAQEIRRGRKGR